MTLPLDTTLLDIRDTKLDIAECLDAVAREHAGGTALFVGTVRNHNEGQAVTGLEYEAYREMALVEMQRIATEIRSEIPGVALSCLHRLGKLEVGDIAVVCAASAAHREQAFVACRALIDRIKARVPIWKREHGAQGPYWVGWEDARVPKDQ
jgi:molybdopterin synthase catalytic subunit